MITIPLLMLLLKSLGVETDSTTLHPYGKVITLSYYGNAHFHPGVKLGYEYAVLNFDKEMKGTETFSSINRQIFASHNLGFFIGNSDGGNIFINTLLGYRYTTPNGYKVEGMAGAGYLLALSLMKPYENDEGKMVRNSLWQQSRIYPSIAMGFGKDFSKRNKAPLVLNIRPALTFKYPHEGRLHSSVMFEGGVGYFLR